MNWIKQNVGLVVGCVIALVLMGVAGWYMLTQIEKDTSITTELNSQRQLVRSLYDRDPHPGKDDLDNIGAVQKEQVRVQKLVMDPLESKFIGFEISTEPSISAFKEILENTLSDLQRQANYTGTSLPSVDQGSYGFSFDDIRPRIDLEEEALRPLTLQLLQISELAKVLFDAKIHGINAIKRLAVSENDSSSSGGGFAMMATTDTSGGSSASSGENYIEGQAKQHLDISAISMPYQISFQCFSSELGRVIDGFNASTRYFRIKWLAVEQSDSSSFSSFGGGGMNPKSMESMYGLAPAPGAGSMGGRYGSSPYGGMGGGQGQGDYDKLEDLDEKPLTVNMSLVGVAIFPEDELESLMPAVSEDEDEDSGGYPGGY